MKWYRIKAILIRHLYLYRRSFPRLMDIFYWPVMELLLWGFLSTYLSGLSRGINIISILLGALIFWDLLSQSQRAVSVAFLEDIWERNLLNIFVTPLKTSEFLTSTVLLGLIRIFIVAVILSLLAIGLYHFNILTFGIYLVPFFINILLFGWILGIFTTAIILRYGSAAQVLAFGFIFLIQPFSAVFYPVSALPESVRFISYILPSTYVFEGMREVLIAHTFSLSKLFSALGLNIIYLVLVVWFFYYMFKRIKEKGMLAKLS
jgi:ABC-2 type transport system permease protein